MIDSVPLDQIASHLEKLRDLRTRRGFRLAHLRIIIRIAQDEYERELQAWNELNSVVADPIITESAGGIVG